MKYREIIENAEAIAAHIRKKKDEFRGVIYQIDINELDPNLKAIVLDSEELLRQKVSSEMRYSDTVEAIKCCQDVLLFSEKLLGSNIPDSLKISLFSKMNVGGYMFDRHWKSYVACLDHLNHFLNTVERYKESLSPPDLQIWNNSTFLDVGQLAFSRGYLQGISASIDS